MAQIMEVHPYPYPQQSLPMHLQRSGSYTRRVLTSHGSFPTCTSPSCVAAIAARPSLVSLHARIVLSREAVNRVTIAAQSPM
jgi:hypothetical protein